MLQTLDAQAVLNYLQSVDPKTAEIARIRYGCLTPWTRDPSLYGQVSINKQYRKCESDVLANLQDLLRKRLDYSLADGERFFNATQNARLVANAERYYRTMYYAENNSWNQRDQHMFDTLQSVLAHRGPEAKAVIWEHNSHIGDARATQMSARGEFNIGQLVRQHYADAAYLIGFGTDHGTVAAASEWGGGCGCGVCVCVCVCGAVRGWVCGWGVCGVCVCVCVWGASNGNAMDL